MQTIWKFKLEISAESVVSMPNAAQVLCVKMQNGEPFVWALVDPAHPIMKRVFNIYGTGHQHETISGDYLGSVLMLNESLVFHVFDKGYMPYEAK